MKTLFLIDANSLIHRAFHALPSLTTPEGKPIQAIYGLASTLLKLSREEKPDYVAALFDRPEPTFRKKLYEEYKAQRPETPEELISQIIEAHNLFSEFGVKAFESVGFEADDLIATLAEKFKEEKNLRIIILTGDLDTLQLVSQEKVVVQTFKKGLSETMIYDAAAIHDRYGLAPSQMVDYKALVGDPSDNIKGVPGVGPKTASSLLKKYGTLERVYRDIGKEPALKAKLGPHEKEAFSSKTLVTLRRDAPLDIQNLADLEVVYSEERIKKYFRNLGFESLIKRLEAQETPTVSPENPKQISIFIEKDLERKVKKGRIVREEATFVADTSGKPLSPREYSSSKLKVGFGLKSLVKVLLKEGEDLKPPYHDLGVAFWLLDPDLKRYNPSPLFKRFLRREWEGSAKDIREAYEVSQGKLREYDLIEIFQEIEMPVLRILVEMENWGVAVNIKKLQKLDAEIEKKLASLTAEIYREAGEEFNINSPKQLAQILIKKLPPKGESLLKKTPHGEPSTRAENLLALQAHLPLAKLILEYRDSFKIQTTYVKPFEELIRRDGRLHTEFIQTGTGTGRLSSREPNLQNIPQESVWARSLRSAFEAPHDFSLLALDYSQIELRILSALSGDPNMIAVFQSGGDVHTATASRVFDVPLEKVGPEMRRVAKILNFGLIYGMGAPAFAKVSGLTPARAHQFINAYFREFSRIREWQEKIKSEARTLGYVKTATGRRRYLPNIVSGSPRFTSEAERAAINHPIQGLAADIMKLAMIKVKAALTKSQWWGREVKMVLSVHDELLFEVAEGIIKEAIPVIRDIMERVYDLGVPLKTEVALGKDWGNLERMNEKKT